MDTKKQAHKNNFARVAEARTDKVIADLRSLGKIADRVYYEYTDSQIERIFKAIEKEAARQKRHLLSRGRDNKFKLSQ